MSNLGQHLPHLVFMPAEKLLLLLASAQMVNFTFVVSRSTIRLFVRIRYIHIDVQLRRKAKRPPKEISETTTGADGEQMRLYPTCRL